jgi:aspartyl-tRNA(Asn)/glutamyl-tRNA(Gln) amidotransferase subunit A
MTITELAPRIRNREISPVELTRETLARIRSLQPKLNAYITVTEEWALKQAEQEEKEIAAGRYRSLLHGIPFAAKDLLYTKGIKTTVGSKILADFVPDFDATVIERLYQAGAILIGKAGLHEWAYGITSNNPHFGTIRNPWDPERIPGGSSGGSAAALAAGMCTFSLGSDTGGSIRIPAAFCGVAGLKPTFGRVSRHGVFPLGHSLDHIGPFGKCVADTALVYQTTCGFDPRDDSTVDLVPDFAVCLPNPRLDGKKIGVPRNFYFEKLDAEVEAATRKALIVFEELGAQLVEIEVPDIEEFNAVARLILLAEASSVHERRLQERRQDFGDDVRGLFDQGRFIPATDYLNAQKRRRHFIDAFRKLLEGVDAVAMPAVPVTAPKIGQTKVQIGGEDYDTRMAVTRNARALNLTGQPILTLPCGFSAAGLPIALQLLGAAFDEKEILEIGHAYEQATEWHKRQPELAS